MGKDDGKQLKELKAELADIEDQLAQSMGNKKALKVKLTEIDEAIRTEYTSAVDQAAVSDLVTGESVVHKVLTTKGNELNRNLRAQREKAAFGLDALGKHLGQLSAKRKRLLADISTLEGKLHVDHLKQSHAHLLESIRQAEAAYGDYHRLLAEAPTNSADIAGRAGIKDEFFFTGIAKAVRPGENLLDWITWASGLTVPGNPFYGGSRRVEGPGHFKRNGLFQGPNQHFQNGK